MQRFELHHAASTFGLQVACTQAMNSPDSHYPVLLFSGVVDGIGGFHIGEPLNADGITVAQLYDY